MYKQIGLLGLLALLGCAEATTPKATTTPSTSSSTKSEGTEQQYTLLVPNMT
jgi:hypothetical protein